MRALKHFFLTILLLVSATSTFAADYYWRQFPADSGNPNFNNPSNWVTNAANVTNPSPTPAMLAQSAPTAADNVHFTSDLTIARTLIITGNANCDTLFFEANANFVFDFNSMTFTIQGNIQSNGRLSTLNYTSVIMSGSKNATIDLGTPSGIHFGRPFTINKSGGARVDLLSDIYLYTVDRNFALSAGNFYSNGHNIIVGAATFSVRPADLTDGGTNRTTLRFTDASRTSEFGTQTSGAATNGLWDCDVISNNSTLNFPNNIQFNSLTLNHATAVILNPTQQTTQINLVVNNLNINTPNVSFYRNDVNFAVWQSSNFASVTVSGTLTLQQICNMIVNQNRIVTSCIFNVNAITFPAASCTAKSTLIGCSPITFKATGNPLDTSGQIMYQNVTFDNTGALVTAAAGDDGGNNSGNVVFTADVAVDFYWIGGTGNWNDQTHWSNSSGGLPVSSGCIPTAKDNVFFDDYSFTDAGNTVTLTTAVSCNNITWAMASGKMGTLVGDNAKSLAIQGNADFSGAVAITPTLYFYGKGTGNFTINSGTTGVYNSPNIFFDCRQSSYQLTSDFLMSTRNSVWHQSGVLDLNGKIILIGNFSSSGGTTRNMQFNGATINCNTLTLNTTGLVAYDFGNSHFKLNGATLTTAGNASGLIPAATFAFHLITCNNNVTTSFGNIATTIDTLTFVGNGTISSMGFTVETLELSPQKSYTLPDNITPANRTITINDTLISNTSECIGLILNSTQPIRPGVIKNNTAKTFSIPGSSITNVVYTPGGNGTNLQVPGGNNGGGNTNVDITQPNPKVWYWVPSSGNAGSGNWSDPNHWSEESGNWVNPGNCTPNMVDTVWFDINSFTAPNQTVTVNITPVTIISMYWTDDAGLRTPTFNLNGATMNLRGSLRWATGMINAGTGTINFTGTNRQVIETNNVSFDNKTLNISGLGRFDLNGNIAFGGGNNGTFSFTGDSLLTNGFNISALTVTITQSANKYIDISNSTISATSWSSLSMTIVNCSNFKSNNTIIAGSNTVSITNSCPVTFKRINSANNLTTSAISTNPVTAKKITVGSNVTINGFVITDTLWYNNNLTITAGRTVTVNNELKQLSSTVTPCLTPAVAIASSSAVQANLDFGYCNPELLFATLRNMNIGLLPDSECENEEQKLLVVGMFADGGGNTGNIEYDMTPPTTTRLLTKQFTCQPSVLDPIQGSTVSQQWFVRFPDGMGGLLRPDSLIVGATGRTLSVSKDAVYVVKPTYGPSCTGEYEVRVTFIPSLRTWQATSLTDPVDWNDPTNWLEDTVPDACSYVIIPGGLSNYPILQNTIGLTPAVCDTIEFQFGGEVKNTHYLKYNGAKVQLDINSNRWYMLSAPLRNTYSGDFYIDTPNPHSDLDGNGMISYMMHFDVANYQSNAPRIDHRWNNAFNTVDVELEAGQGLAFYANPKNSGYNNQDVLSNLGKSFWFPKNDTIHYYWSILGAKTGESRILSRAHKHRFIYEDVIDASGLVPLSHSRFVADQMVLVGNPFMSQLDFEAFVSSANPAGTANSALIYDEYKIAYGVNSGEDGAMNDFVTYKGIGGEYVPSNPSPEDNINPLTRYIPPMQSFIVYARTNSLDSLKADIVNHTAVASQSYFPSVPVPNTLRSRQSTDKELLYVRASRGTQKSHAVVVHWSEGNKNFYPTEDSRKLFDEQATKPVLVYLMSKDGIALDIHTTNDLNEMIPIGIRTSAVGKITLSFTGIENFPNRQIKLHDTKENRIIHLNEEDEYSFFKLDQEMFIENRFFISFEDFTGIENLNQAAVYLSNPTRKTIRIYSPKAIQNIEILDIQGRILLREENLHRSTFDYQVNAPGVYMVRISGQTKKVVVK